MRWNVWARYTRAYTVDTLNSGRIFEGNRVQVAKAIDREAEKRGYPPGAYFIQSETDQILSWTVDGSGRKRKFISMNAE